MPAAVAKVSPVEKELETVIDEVRLLFNTLVQRGEALHARDSVTMGMRAVLEFLANNGATTVPNIARSRRVSRQHIQALVNPLLEIGLVRAVSNPSHKRSPLMALTGRGERKIQQMRSREARVFEHGDVGLTPAQLRRVAEGLCTLRAAVER
jgi:DNA-binding MarR family transcriptional regulator